MKRLLCLSLLAAVFMASTAYSFQYWGDDYSSYDAGDNLLDLGYTTFSTYAGAPVIVEAFGTKCLQLQKSEGGSEDYNMILTPVIGPDWATLAESGYVQENFDVVIKGTVCPGSGVDLFALYGQSTNRFFFFNCNTSGLLATDPASQLFENVKTDALNEISATLRYSDGVYKLVKVTVNDETWEGESACASGDAPRFLRLSTQLSTLAEGNEGAIYGNAAIDFVSRGDSNTMYLENFDSYEDGTQMAEQPGWAFFSTYSGNTTVTSGLEGFEGKGMVLSQSEGGSDAYVMVLTPAIELNPPNPGTQYAKITCKFICGSGTDLIAFYDMAGTRWFYLLCNGDAGTAASNPAGIEFDNLSTDGKTLNTISFTYDSLDNKIVGASCNGTTVECDIAGGSGQPTRLRLSTQLSSKLEGAETSYDYVEVKAVNRSDDPMLNCVNSVLIQLDTTETTFDLYNAGPETGTVNYQVAVDGEWLTVTPSEGSFNVSEKLTLSVKEGYQDTWRRTKMTVNAGEAGVKVVDVMYQGGNIIFAENFNDMEDGSIVGQRGWTLDVGKVVVTNAYECDGKCMFHYISGGNDACSMYLPKPWYENLIVKVSYKLYWPSDSNASGVCPLQKESGTTEKFEAGYVPDDEGFSLLYIMKYSGGQNVDKSVKNFPLAPYDTWVDISYTMDLQDNRLLSFSWDGYTTNFNNWALTNPDCHSFNSWGHADYDPAGENAKHGVDDLVIERIPREAAPKLSADQYVNCGTNATLSISIKNLGSGSFDYTAEVIDLDDALTIENPTGKVKESVSLNITPDRSKLDPNFYRARVKVDGGEAGCATSVVAFVVGNVYYFSDFEEPFFKEGDITGQDEWENDWPEGNNAYVLTTNATQCLMIETGGGYGGYYHALDVPRNSFMRFDMDLFVPSAIFEDPERLTIPMLHLKQNSTYQPSIELRVAPDVMDGVPILVGDAVGYEDYPLVIAEYAGEWTHLSYTIDYMEGKLVEFSIGDVTENPDYVYTYDSDVPCTLFCVCVGSQVNLQVDNVKVSVVPEPAVLGLLALLGLALLRRK